MGLFVKDKEIIDISPAHVAKVMQVKKTLDKNAEKINMLIVLAKSNHSIEQQLKDLYIEIKYSNPVVSEEVERIDKEISDKLDSIKLILSRGKLRSDLALNHNLRDLNQLVVERRANE